MSQEIEVPEIDPNFEAKRKQAIHDFFENGDANNFDLYAQDPGRWASLSRAIPGLIVTSAGGIVPYQAEGKLQGHPFYFRYRHGVASLRLGEINSDEMPYLDGALYSASDEYGDEYGGILSPQEFQNLMIKLVGKLERAPFYWKFNARKVKVNNRVNEGDELTFTITDEWETVGAWGHTPEEALARLGEISEYLLSHGFSEKFQLDLFAAKEVDPAPVNSDDRIFPDPEPRFNTSMGVKS